MASSTLAQEVNRDSEGFRALFNGKDLSGWVRVNTAPSTWSVRDGLLHCTGKPTGELRTERMFQNFVLEVEWRHLRPRGNAGIFVWADDITARGQPFHRSIEVQVLENAYGNTRGYTTHGDIFPIHGARMKPINGRGGSRAFPTENRSKASPEWNHYTITCQDGTITLAVNGKVVTRGEDCSPRKGYICLESEGGVVDYRNLRIRELPDTPLKPEDVAIADRGFECLYSGVDLSGWKTSSAGWKPKDWVLAYSGDAARQEGAALESERLLGDFRFVLDVRRHAGSGAGRVLLRGSDSASIPLDPAHPLLGGAMTKGWNRFEGELVGSTLKLTLNGRLLCDELELEDLPARGPLRIEPVGPIDLANPFVAESRPPRK